MGTARQITRVHAVLAAVSFSIACDSLLGITKGHPRQSESPMGGSSGKSDSSGNGGTMAGAESDGGTSGKDPSLGGAGSGGKSGQTAAGSGGKAQGGRGGRPASGGTGGGITVLGGEGGDAGEGGFGGADDRTCRESDRSCDETGKVPLLCMDGEWQPQTACRNFCQDGACRNPPSCALLDNCRNATSCCSAWQVPEDTFSRSYDDDLFPDDNYQATVSSYLLDEFEVTVGRFRNFVASYDNLELIADAGKALHIDEDLGWRVSYPLPGNADDLRGQLACDAGATWTDDATGDEQLPINCVNFFVAYAFCIWDGGRLPTEAEWNLAAAGGSEHRVYPWSQPPGDSVIDPEDAIFESFDLLPPRVGSSSGDGRWGHADLAGSVYEWNLDDYADPYPSTACDDCLVTTGTGTRSLRGGAFSSFAEDLRVAMRSSLGEQASRYFAGFRCARDIARSTPNP
jgi:formylglycine-generating enzyme